MSGEEGVQTSNRFCILIQVSTTQTFTCHHTYTCIHSPPNSPPIQAEWPSLQCCALPPSLSSQACGCVTVVTDPGACVLFQSSSLCYSVSPCSGMCVGLPMKGSALEFSVSDSWPVSVIQCLSLSRWFPKNLTVLCSASLCSLCRLCTCQNITPQIDLSSPRALRTS